MYRIGDFSKMSKTTIKTLRYYDEIGLLKPAETDPFTGYRLYTTEQLYALHRIQSYRQIGLSIDEVKLLLSGVNAHGILARRKAELITQLSDASDQLSRLEFILQGHQEERFMNYAATIKQTPECIVYSVDYVTPSYDAYFQTIPAIGAKVMERYPGLKCTIPEYCFIRYLDGEYKERDIHVEFCEAVNCIMPDFDDVVFKKLPSIPVLSILHKGPYSQLGEAYAFAMQWMEQNGYLLCDAPRESYIDGIWNKEDEGDWLTELQFPIVTK